MALFEHVDPGDAASRGDQGLLHAGGVHKLPIQHRTARQYGGVIEGGREGGRDRDKGEIKE